MILLPLTAQYFTDPTLGFYLCIMLLLIFGIVSGIVQNTIFGLAGMLPPKYMGAVMLGNGLSGITCNLINCITLAAFPNDLFLGSIVYFVIAACMLIVCLFCKLVLRQNEFSQYYI
jgi:equilibrative nucleoside transporter 1/2/3